MATINGVYHPTDSDTYRLTGTGAGAGDLGELASSAGQAAMDAAAAALAEAKDYTDENAWLESSALSASTDIYSLPTRTYRVGSGSVATSLDLPSPAAGFLQVLQQGNAGIIVWRPNRRDGAPEVHVAQQLANGDWSPFVRMFDTDDLLARTTGLAVRENLIPNPSFEAGVAHVQAYSSDTTVVRGGSANAMTVGNHHARVTYNWSPANAGEAFFWQDVPVTPGKFLSFSAFTRSNINTPGFRGRVRLEYRATGQGNVSVVNFPARLLTSLANDYSLSSPNRDAIVSEVPAGADFVRVGYTCSRNWDPSLVNGLVVFTDAWAAALHDTEREAKAALRRDYFDGDVDMDASSILTPQWAGTAQSSPSRLVIPAAETPMFTEDRISDLADRSVTLTEPQPTGDVVTAAPVQYPLPGVGNHDAFPGLTRLTDGSYLAIWRNGSTHISDDGQFYTSRSLDGREWSAPTLLEQDIPGDGRGPAISTIGGTVVLTYYLAAPGPQRSYLRRSTDDGHTWGPSELLPFDSGGIEFTAAPAVEVNGAWLVTAYGNSAVRVLRSTDQGATWSDPIIVVPGGVQEPNLVYLGGNSVRIFWRINYGGVIRTARSDDGGLTWGPDEDAFWGQGNPHVTRLRSGTLVMVYKSPDGHSINTYSYGCVRLSRNNGATWGPEVRFGHVPRKMTYGQAVETDVDGELLCVWGAETANSRSRLYAVRLTDGAAITPDGGSPSPVTPRPGIARQWLGAQKSTDQTIPTDTWTAVQWEDEREDHWEGINPSRSLTEFRVSESGLYAVTFRAAWDAATPFSLAISSGTGEQILNNRWDSTADGQLTGVVHLDEDSYYEAQVHQTSGSGAALKSGATADCTRLTIAKIKGDT